MNASHIPVLLNEAVQALISDPSGIYVDGTFGRGGHSRRLLEKLSSSARLVAFDKDPDAITIAQQLAAGDQRFAVIHDSFAKAAALDNLLAQEFAGVTKPYLSGALLDLGVSSPQLDQADRGFSFMHDGPLDMRMNPEEGESAAQWLSHVSLQEFARVLREYGEERYAKRIAQAVVDLRDQKNALGELITSTYELAETIKKAHPNWDKHKHPATKSFQAIRIQINSELDDLLLALENYSQRLLPGGRLAVISFHSLEDRIVKRFFKHKSSREPIPKHLPLTDEQAGSKEPDFRLVGKSIKASAGELSENIRARSAVLRVLEKR